MLHPVIALGLPSGGEWIVVAIVAVLLFGKRLPEVGKSLGKGIVEFKKGLRGIEEDVEQGVTNPTPAPAASAPTSTAALTANHQPALPPGSKFDPLTGKPLESQQSSSPPPQQTIAREKPQYRFDPYTGEKIGAGEENR